MIQKLPEVVVANSKLHRVCNEFPKARQQCLFKPLPIGRLFRRRENPCPAGQTQADNALFAQQPVRMAHGMKVDRQRLCQLTDAGQLIAWLKLAAAKLLLNNGGDLLVDGSRIVMVD